MSVLTLDYRPVAFREVIGQKHAIPVIRSMIRKDDMVPALILTGVRGTGKTTTARILAAALNCEDQQDGDACGKCASCVSVQKTDSDSVLEVDAASNGGVAEVARIRELCLYAHTGKWRVIVLDEAHSMSRDAFNALLKILEEPPPKTVFVLLTTEADKILETVRSRSMTFEFRRIPDEQIVERLAHIVENEGIECDESLLRAVAADAKGGMRDAVMLLDQCRRADVKDADGYGELMGRVDIAMPLLDALIEGAVDRAYGMVQDYFVMSGDLLRLVDDVTQKLVECTQALAGVPDLEAAGLANRLTGDRLMQSLKVMWETRDRVAKDMGDPIRLAELMVALLAGSLTAASAPRAAAPAAAPVAATPILTPKTLSRADVVDVLRASGALKE